MQSSVSVLYLCPDYLLWLVTVCLKMRLHQVSSLGNVPQPHLSYVLFPHTLEGCEVYFYLSTFTLSSLASYYSDSLTCLENILKVKIMYSYPLHLAECLARSGCSMNVL